MRLLKKDGALTIRDIDDDVLVEKVHAWASRKPSKRALQLAFYEGRVTISERNGMLKTYELMERHFGWDKPPKPASAREITGYLLDRALRAQGIVSLDSICHLDAPSKASVRRLIEARVRRKELVPVAIEGAGKQEHWALPEALESAAQSASDLVHVLSPFDPLIIQRKRTQLVFDYEHRFEAYVPKEKRRFGYFALPVLVGDDIVAALDLKTDRRARKLLLQKWNWVGAPKARAQGPQAPDRRRVAPLRAVSACGVRGERTGDQRAGIGGQAISSYPIRCYEPSCDTAVAVKNGFGEEDVWPSRLSLPPGANWRLPRSERSRGA